MRKYFWFHNASWDGCEFFSSDDQALPVNASYGPFASFGEAKKDAIKYYRADIDLCRERIRELNGRRIWDPNKN